MPEIIIRWTAVFETTVKVPEGYNLDDVREAESNIDFNGMKDTTYQDETFEIEKVFDENGNEVETKLIGNFHWKLFSPFFKHQGVIQVPKQINTNDDGKGGKLKCGYIAMYRNEQVEVFANTIFGAKEIAIAYFKPPKSQARMVAVMLCEHYDKDGNVIETVEHTADR